MIGNKLFLLEHAKMVPFIYKVFYLMSFAQKNKSSPWNLKYLIKFIHILGKILKRLLTVFSSLCPKLFLLLSLLLLQIYIQVWVQKCILILFSQQLIVKIQVQKVGFFAKFESAHKLYEFYSSFSALHALNIRD